MNQQFLTELNAVVEENRIFTDEPMKKHTTFRVGGPADVLVMPERAELEAVIRLCRTYDRYAPWYFLPHGCVCDFMYRIFADSTCKEHMSHQK